MSWSNAPQGCASSSRSGPAEHGIRLASARGVNAQAVAEHAIALILALARRLPEARDNQRNRVWRGMIGDLAAREDELGGKTLLIVGLGDIGGRLARLAKAFDMRVIGLRRDPKNGAGAADAVHGMGALKARLPEADFVALTCPLVKDTENLIDADALGRMKRSAFLINVARGRCVDESALAKALAEGRIAGAAIDVTVEEPLARASPLWTPPLRGQCPRYPHGQSGPAVARRRDATQLDPLSKTSLPHRGRGGTARDSERWERV